MRRAWAVFKREYLQAVRKTSFIVMTLLTPLLMAGSSVIPGFLITRGMGGKRVVVVDGTGRLREALAEGRLNQMSELAGKKEVDPRMRGVAMPAALGISVDYVASGGDVEAATKQALGRLTGEGVPKDRRVDGVLAVPENAFDDPEARLTFYSRSASDMMTQERLGRAVNRAIEAHRLRARGLDPEEIARSQRSLKVDPVQVSRTGERVKGGELNSVVGMLFAVLLFIPMLMYGVEIMRGILQEKTDRVVEILISSMTPMELLVGKVLGLAAVGLTQVAVWVLMGLVVASYFGAMALAAGVNIAQFFRPALVPYFLVFYVLGYLLYVCVYAVGGAITNSEKEAQQAMMPAMLIVMVPWFLIGPIMLNPESTLSTTLSLIPLFSPVIMFLRVLLGDPPLWQVWLSILMTSLLIWGMFWATAKIFRIGILSYGKRPTARELWAWLKVA
jgi:ABC-2 type transport system permease protein